MRLWLHIYALLLWLQYPLSTLSAPNIDPYAVLKVSQKATADEIRRQYKKQCLANHPDKNMGKSEKEARLCEERFKQVQKANALIGDPDARKQYDDSLRFGGGGGNAQAAEDFYRAFYGQREPRRGRRGTGGIYTSPDGGFKVRFNNEIFDEAFSPFFAGKATKSRYVQRVKVPLRDLYSGRNSVDFVLKDNVFKRYAAAVRGGVAGPLWLSSLLVSLSTMTSIRFPFNFVIGIIYFHVHVPKPSNMDYKADIKAGWKGGTKLKFRDVEPGFEVDFIVEEEEDGSYVRIGNDLHTTLTISSSEAEQGGTFMLEHLDESQVPIQVAGHITKSGDQVVLKGKGWPRKVDGEAGDLVVTINIASRRQKKKSKRSKKCRK